MGEFSPWTRVSFHIKIGVNENLVVIKNSFGKKFIIILQ